MAKSCVRATASLRTGGKNAHVVKMRGPKRFELLRRQANEIMTCFPIPVSLPFYPSTPIQDAGKAAYSATSLKRQKTEQVFSGAVAAIAIIYRPPAPPAGTMPEKSSLQARSTATALHSTTTAFDSKNTKVSYQPSHPLQGQSHSRTSSSSSSSANSLKKRQHRQPVFLHIANVGDCRAVLCRGGNAVAITTDHTPSVPSEAARVEAAGGFVSRGRVNGILGVSRSFGDIHCKVRAVLLLFVRVKVMSTLLLVIVRACGTACSALFLLDGIPPPPLAVRYSLPRNASNSLLAGGTQYASTHARDGLCMLLSAGHLRLQMPQDSMK